MKNINLKLRKIIAVFMCVTTFALSTGCSAADIAQLDTSALFPDSVTTESVASDTVTTEAVVTDSDTSDSVAQVIAAIRSSEYSAASEIYSEEISGNLELEKEVESQLSGMISDAIDSYNSGEKTYDEAELLLETIERAGIYSSSSLSDSFEELESIRDEKEYYACMEAVIADAEALVADGSYSEAYDVLKNEYSYDFEGEELYDAEVEKVQSLWEEAVLAEAAEAFGTDKDYTAAIQVLQRSGLVTDTIDAEIAKYQEYIPISLTSLEYTQKGTYVKVRPSSSSDYTDVSGNEYDATTVIYPWASAVSGGNYITYYLNAEYSTLTGTLFRPYSTLKFSDDWTSSVQIYGDGVLLYETSEITSDTYTTLDFEVDITGVRELTIYMSGTLGVVVAPGGVTSYPCVCATNLMISK
ncbi:MAG: NPCBM/NEW2 domain-containing protein [Oscillospiraceae bacterium]|nr:NPCBM/NEW2 domain-containing protein [Oscillospiraceae bacterium]